METIFRFKDPFFLLLLLLVPGYVYYELKLKKRPYFVFSDLSLVAAAGKRRIPWHRLTLVIRVLVVILIILALARPQSGSLEREVSSPGVDIMLCLDTSGSMQGLDFEVKGERRSRLDVIKEVVTNFIKKRKTDRIGMVVYGAEAFTQCPLTMDYGVLADFLSRLKIGMAGDQTAIGDALAIAVKRLKDIKAKSKIIILLTDGVNNTGSIEPLEAAGLAKTFDIKIYTVGVGTVGPVPFLVDTPFGPKYVMQRVDLDKVTLEKIAAVTGGKFFLASDTEKLGTIYETIDKMEKTTVKIKEYSRFEELFPYLIMLAGIFLLLEVFLANTVLRTAP
ncbi:MAG: VWA domain-containing protein [Deltaproteobacteria bacterium]|nr:VWA domain-containing protein [Deltaproteobacteria bacterium]